jgi:hypothetical protein
MIRTYQAIDSVTGGLYTWQAAVVDHLGTGYPGPNSPTHVLQISPEYWHGDPGPGGAAYAAQWHDLVNTDFTAQPDQTFSADGDVTVDGLVWTVRNYARRVASSVFSVEAGSTKGLRLPCQSTTYATQSAANQAETTQLFFPLTSAANYSLLTNRTPIRAVCRLNRIIGVSNPHEQGFCISLKNPSAALISSTFASGKTSYGVTTSLGNLAAGCYFLGTSTGGYSGITGRSGANRYLGWEVGGVGPRRTRYLIAPSAHDAIADIDAADVYREAAATTTYSGSEVNDDYFALANWGIAICALTGSSTYIDAGDMTYVSHFRAQAWY